MSLVELLPNIQALSRTDKLRLIQLLAADVASEDGIAFDVSEKIVPIWSPHDAFQGAATLLDVLNEERISS